MNNLKIVMLVGRGESSNIIYNSLRKEFQISKLIIENRVSSYILIKKRIKKLGYGKVLGQILFKMVLLPFINMKARKRLAELYSFFDLDNKLTMNENILFVNSVNSDATIQLLKKIKPDLIIVNGTRIISQRVLKSISCNFVNIHVGITPKYRGVHGGYWALANNDYENCGVTIHFIDSGIDTGNIIEQALIEPTCKDNFVTYPVLQLNVGISLLKKTIKNFIEDRVSIKKNDLESKLWTHPTILEYLKFRLTKGVK